MNKRKRQATTLLLTLVDPLAKFKDKKEEEHREKVTWATSLDRQARRQQQQR